MKKIFAFALCSFICLLRLNAQNFIAEKNETGSFPIVSVSASTAIYVDQKDHWLVQKAASLLQADIEKVTGKKPAITKAVSGKNIIIIGSLDQSPVIQELVR